jgi:hypothetical protein
MPSPATPATRPLSRLERLGVALFFLTLVGFGVLTE